MKLAELRKEAKEIVKKNENLVIRSCWNCNSAHKWMKKDKACVILCYDCGNYYYKGVKVSE
jgi:hypothetical protein